MGRKNKKNKSNKKSSAKKQQQHNGSGDQQQPPAKQENKVETIQQAQQQKKEQINSNDNAVDESEYVCTTPKKTESKDQNQVSQVKEKKDPVIEQKTQQMHINQKPDVENKTHINDQQPRTQVEQDLLSDGNNQQPQTMPFQQNNQKDKATPKVQQQPKNQISDMNQQQQGSTPNAVEVDEHNNEEETTETKVQSVDEQVKKESGQVSNNVDQPQQQLQADQQNQGQNIHEETLQKQGHNPIQQKQAVQQQINQNNQPNGEYQTQEENNIQVQQQDKETPQGSAHQLKTQSNGIQSSQNNQQEQRKENKALDQSQYLQRKHQQSLISSELNQIDNAQQQPQQLMQLADMKEKKEGQIPDVLTDSKAQMANSLKQIESQHQSQEGSNSKSQQQSHQNISFKKTQTAENSANVENTQSSKETIEKNTSNQIKDQVQSKNWNQKAKKNSLNIKQIEENQVIHLQNNQLNEKESSKEQLSIQQSLNQGNSATQQQKAQEPQIQQSSNVQTQKAHIDEGKQQEPNEHQQGIEQIKKPEQVQDDYSNQVFEQQEQNQNSVNDLNLQPSIHRPQAEVISSTNNQESIRQSQNIYSNQQQKIDVQVEESVNTILRDVQANFNNLQDSNKQMADLQQPSNQKQSSQIIAVADQSLDVYDQNIALIEEKLNQQKNILAVQSSQIQQRENTNIIDEAPQNVHNTEEDNINSNEQQDQQSVKQAQALVGQDNEDINIIEKSIQNNKSGQVEEDNAQIMRSHVSEQNAIIQANKQTDAQTSVNKNYQRPLVLQQSQQQGNINSTEAIQVVHEGQSQIQNGGRGTNEQLANHQQSGIKVQVPEDNQRQEQAELEVQNTEVNRPASQANQYQSDDSQLLPFSAPTKQKSPSQQHNSSPQKDANKQGDDLDEPKVQDGISAEQLCCNVIVNMVETPPDRQNDENNEQVAEKSGDIKKQQQLPESTKQQQQQQQRQSKLQTEEQIQENKQYSQHPLQNKTSMDEELTQHQINTGRHAPFQQQPQSNSKHKEKPHRYINIDIDQIETANNHNQSATNKTIDSPISKIQSDKLIQASLQYEKEKQQQLIKEMQENRQREIRQQLAIKERQQQAMRQREQQLIRQQQLKKQTQQREQLIRAQQLKQAEQRNNAQASIQRQQQQNSQSYQSNTSGTSGGLKIHTVKVSSKQPQFLGRSGLNINQNLIIRGDTQNQQFPSFSRKEYPAVYEKQGQPATQKIQPQVPAQVPEIRQTKDNPAVISQSTNAYSTPLNTTAYSQTRQDPQSLKRKQFFQSHSRPAQQIMIGSEPNKESVNGIDADTRSIQKEYSEKPMQFQESQMSVRQQREVSIKQQSQRPTHETHFPSNDFLNRDESPERSHFKPLGQNQPNVEEVFSQTAIPLQPRKFVTHMEAQSHHKQQQQDLHDPTNTPLESQSPTFNYYQRRQQHHVPSGSEVAEQLKKIAVHPIHHLHPKPNYEGSNIAVCQTQIQKVSTPSLKGNSSERIETHSDINSGSRPNQSWNRQTRQNRQKQNQQDPIVIARKHSQKFKQLIGDDSAQKKIEDIQKSLNSDSNWKKNSPNIVFNQIGRQVKSFSPPPQKVYPPTVSPSSNQKYNYQYSVHANRTQSHSFYEKNGIKDNNQAQSTFRKQIPQSVELKQSLVQNSNKDKKIVIGWNLNSYSSPQGLKKDILETHNNNHVNYSPSTAVNAYSHQNRHNVKVNIGNTSFNRSQQEYPKQSYSHGFGQNAYDNYRKQKIENFTERDTIQIKGHPSGEGLKKQKLHILLKHNPISNTNLHNNGVYQASPNRVIPQKISINTPDSIKNNTAPFYNARNDIRPEQNIQNSREKSHQYSIDYHTHRPLVKGYTKTEHQQSNPHSVKIQSNSKWNFHYNNTNMNEREFNTTENYGTNSQIRDNVENLNFSRSTHAVGKLNSHALEKNFENKNYQSRDRKIYTYSHEKKQSNVTRNNQTKEKASLSRNKQVLMYHHSHSKGKKQKIAITLNRDHLKPKPKYQIFNANRMLRHNQNINEKKVEGIVKQFERSPYKVNQKDKSKRSQYQLIGLGDSRLKKKAEDKQYIQKKFQYIASKGTAKPLPKFNQAYNKQMLVQQSQKQVNQFNEQERPLWERVKSVIERGNPLLPKKDMQEGLSDVEDEDVNITSKR